MDVLALVIACLAAAFTGLQWHEARRSRKTADKAQAIAEKVDARQTAEEERAAVRWRPRMHPEYTRWVQFENVGHSTAYEVRIAHEGLEGVRHDPLRAVWRLEAGEFYTLVVADPMDLADMPDVVKVLYRMRDRSDEDVAVNVSLSDLRETFRRLADEDRKNRIEAPIVSKFRLEQLEAEHRQRLAQSEQQSAPTAGQFPPSEQRPGAAPGEPELPKGQQD